MTKGSNGSPSTYEWVGSIGAIIPLVILPTVVMEVTTVSPEGSVSGYEGLFLGHLVVVSASQEQGFQYHQKK